jgi:hypothetical protein
MTSDINQSAGDLLLGAKAIAQFVNTLFDGEPFSERDVWNWCAYKKLPHAKHGASIVASKRKITEHFYQMPAAPRKPW